MELKDTVELMLSSDYRNRFKAEYWQTKIRYDRLHKQIVHHDAGLLDLPLNCNIELLKHQANAMGSYLFDLEVRAAKDGIEL